MENNTDKIKTRRNERRLSRGLVDVALSLIDDRTDKEGVNKTTAKRHASAIRGVVGALGAVRSKVTKPGIWVSLYSRSDATSTVISNMKFTAVIFEWAGRQDYQDAPFYSDVANAIRIALAVRGDNAK